MMQFSDRRRTDSYNDNCFEEKDFIMQATNIKRFEGRLFAEEGRLCLVVEVKEEERIARVSCCIDGNRTILEMPIAEVGKRLSAGSDLVLDNINGEQAKKRVVKKKDGWFFSAREGLKGPFDTEDAAEAGLQEHILAAQSTAAAG